MANERISAPLEGIKVLDLSRLLPGDLASLMLLDMGAEVVKVEDKEQGDYLREIPPYIEGQGAFFRLLNRGKKSITIDLKKEEGRALFLKLLPSFDILIETFRTGVMGRLGLSFEEVSKVNPRMIYVSISGYGRGNSLTGKGSHDLNYLALSGCLYLLSTVERQPEIPLIQFGDIMGGSFQSVVSILSSLFRRERTGEGAYLDISILDGLLSSLIMSVSEVIAGEEVMRDNLGGSFALYNLYETMDKRYLAIASLEPESYRRMLEILDVGFETPLSDLKRTIEERIRSRPLNEWREIFSNEDICITPVLKLEEALESDFVREKKLLFEVGGPAKHLSIKTPVANSLFRPYSIKSSPEKGEDTVRFFLENGLTAEEIDDLMKRGVI